MVADRGDASVVGVPLVLEGKVAAPPPVDRVHRSRIANVAQSFSVYFRLGGVVLAFSRFELLFGNNYATQVFVLLRLSGLKVL